MIAINNLLLVFINYEEMTMPVQIIMTEGLVTKEKAQEIHHAVTEVFLQLHQMSENAFMVPNVIGEVVFVEKGLTFAGKEVKDIAIVELRVPSFAFGTQEQKTAFVERVTDIVLKATDNKLPIDQIWVNAVYAVDGLWGIAGRAYTNEDLGNAISEAA